MISGCRPAVPGPDLGDGPATGCWVAALSELSAKEIEIQRLKETIHSQEETIQTLKQQITQMKAVDLELVQPEPAGEVP
jgi:hypothetical protein